MKSAFIATLIGVLLLEGCCSACRQRTRHARPLEETTWHLVQIEGRDIAADEGTYDIRLSGGSLTGTVVCNHMMGNYTLGDAFSIRFGATASTKMFCPNEELEPRLAAVLETATHYDIDYDMLMLLQDGAIKAVFKAVEPKGQQRRSVPAGG